MKKITILLLVLLMASCAAPAPSSSALPSSAPAPSSSAPASSLPPPSSSVEADDFSLLDTSQWQTQSAEMIGLPISLRLPDGVRSDGNAIFWSTSDTVPNGFIPDTGEGEEEEYMVGRIRGAFETTKIDENTYEMDKFGVIASFEYSETQRLNTFSYYEQYIVFVDHDELDSMIFVDIDNDICVIFWIDWEAFEEGRRMFYSIVSTITVG